MKKLLLALLLFLPLQSFGYVNYGTYYQSFDGDYHIDDGAYDAFYNELGQQLYYSNQYDNTSYVINVGSIYLSYSFWRQGDGTCYGRRFAYNTLDNTVLQHPWYQPNNCTIKHKVDGDYLYISLGNLYYTYQISSASLYSTSSFVVDGSFITYDHDIDYTQGILVEEYASLPLEVNSNGTLINTVGGFQLNSVDINMDYNIERELRKYNGPNLELIDYGNQSGFSGGIGNIGFDITPTLEDFASYQLKVKYINNEDSEDFQEVIYNKTYFTPELPPNIEVLNEGTITSLSNGFRINNIDINQDFEIDYQILKLEGAVYNLIDSGSDGLFLESTTSLDITTIENLDSFGTYRLIIDYINNNAPNTSIQVIYDDFLYIEPYIPPNIEVLNDGTITSLSNGFTVNNVNVNIDYNINYEIRELINGSYDYVTDWYISALDSGTGSFNITTNEDLTPFGEYKITIKYINPADTSEFITKIYYTTYTFNTGYIPPTSEQFIFNATTFQAGSNGFFYNSIPDPYGGAFYFDIIAPNGTGGTINLTTEKYYDYTIDGNGYGFDGGIKVTMPYHQNPGTYQVRVNYEYNNIIVYPHGDTYQSYEITVAETPADEEGFNNEIDELSICDSDLNGTIEVGEGLACPFKTIGYYSKEVYANLVSIKDFFLGLMKLGTSEVKNFSFVYSVHADNFMSGMGAIEDQQSNYLTKMFFFIKGFIIFVFIILSITLIIYLKQN